MSFLDCELCGYFASIRLSVQINVGGTIACTTSVWPSCAETNGESIAPLALTSALASISACTTYVRPSCAASFRAQTQLVDVKYLHDLFATGYANT